MARRRTFAKRAVDKIADWLRIVVLGLTAPLPFRWRSAVGGKIARLLLMILPGARRRMDLGIATAFPELSAAERAALIKSSAEAIGRTQVEIFLSRSLETLVDSFHIEGPGLAAIENAAQDGKGAILVSGHFGQWEAIRLYLKSRGLETGAIYRRFASPEYEEAFRKAFEYNGKPVFQRGGRGTRDMVRHLKGGGRIAILADQAQKSAPVLTFFGEPAHSSLAAAEMALKYDVPLVPVYGIRGADPMQFTVRFEPPIAHGDARTMTQAINDSLENMVRTHPEQWFWVHRRWKIAPRTERKRGGQQVQG